MAKQISNFLESVLADNKERTFGSIDNKSKVKIPLLITKKTDKNVTRYSTDFSKIAGFENLKTNPNRIQIQNVAQASLLYSIYTTLGHDNKNIQELNEAINLFQRGGSFEGKTIKRFSVDAEKLVNSKWKNVQDTATTEQKSGIMEVADLLATRAINEMHETGELKAAGVDVEKATQVSTLMLKAFQSNLLHSKNTPMTTSHEVSEIYSPIQDKINTFLEQRYGSSNKEDYLYTLMSNHASDIQDLCDPANLKFDDLINLIKFVPENSKADESTGISGADYRAARINSKKNAKGKITAYIKEDEQFKDVHHLLINVTYYEGQANHSNSLMLLSHNELATDLHSPNLLTKHLKQAQDITPLLNEQRLEELKQQRIANEELQRQSAQRLVEENAQKRQAAIQTFEQATPVTNAEQLEGTYFAQKSAALLAIKSIPNMRIDADKTVWIPLANVAESNPTMDNIEGFQKLLADKDPLLQTNKLFEGIGEGRKNKASATIGDIDNAALIIESEGIVNGLIAIEMAEQKGIKAAAVCGLDVGNLPYTLGRILESHPTKPVINLADNDLFNSDKERRYLPHELAARNMPETGKTVNVGLKRAAEMTNAVNLPHIHFDFANDFGENLEALQQDQKGSDIDDALNIVYQNLSEKGVDAPHVEAWEIVKESLYSKIETTMKYHVSPNWSVENQDAYEWCPSADNLGKEGLPDFYHLKDIINGVNEVFEKNHQMSYETYRHLVSTRHDPQNEAEVEIDQDLLAETEAKIDQYIEDASNPNQSDDIGEQIQSEPLVQLDADIPHLVAPTINESSIYIDTKIHSITRRLDNLSATAGEWLHYENAKRVDKHMATLHKLVDEKSRLLGVSARQLQSEPQLAVYFDREREIEDAQLTAAQQVDFVPSTDDWLDLEGEEENRTVARDADTFDFQLEDTEALESAAPSDQTSAQLLNQVLGGQQVEHPVQSELDQDIEEQKIELSPENQELVDMYGAFIEDAKESLDEYLSQPHSDPQKHYDSLVRETMAIDATLNHLSTLMQSSNADQLKTDLGLNRYYEALEQANEALAPSSNKPDHDTALDDLMNDLPPAQPLVSEPNNDPIADQAPDAPQAESDVPAADEVPVTDELIADQAPDAPQAQSDAPSTDEAPVTGEPIAEQAPDVQQAQSDAPSADEVPVTGEPIAEQAPDAPQAET
ncbi:hypothetical protein, partial [Vibrio agarivorans]